MDKIILSQVEHIKYNVFYECQKLHEVCVQQIVKNINLIFESKSIPIPSNFR